MRVNTPIADLEIAIGRLAVEDGALVLTSAENDMMRIRAVFAPRDVRKIICLLLRPGIIWFAVTCLFRSGHAVQAEGGADDGHPTPSPW